MKSCFRRLAGAVVIAAAGLFAGGCLIQVQIDEVRDPGPAFKRARSEALRVQGRRGPAHELHALVYEKDEGRLVRVTLPMWVVRKIEGKIDWDDDDRRRRDHDARERGDRLEKRLRRHVTLEDIEKAGLGILVEVEEDDGAQVLVWLQ
jgi:hypothetical protein